MITNTVATRITVDDQMTKHLQNAQRHMQTFAGTVDKQSSQIMNDFKRIATSVVSVTIAFQALKKVINEGVSFNVFMQDQQTAFRVMMKSSDEAKAKIAELYDYAVNTPLTFKETTSAAKQLLAYGFASEELLGSLRTLGTVAKATGHSLSDITYVYGTLRSQGRAYSRDLMQFGMRGIPIYEELGKVMGVGNEELKKMTEEGKVGFKEVEQAFNNMTGEGGRFFGMLEEKMKDLSGKASMLTDIYQQSAGALVKGLTDQLLPSIDKLIERLKDAKDAFTAVGEVGGYVFKGLADAIFFVVDHIDILIAVGAAFAAMTLPAIVVGLKAVAAAAVVAGAAMLAIPGMGIALALSAAVVGFKKIIDIFLEYKKEVEQELKVGASINGLTQIRGEMASMRASARASKVAAPSPTKEMNDYMSKLQEEYAKFLAVRQRDEEGVIDAVVNYERMKRLEEAKTIFGENGKMFAEAKKYIDAMADYEAATLKKKRQEAWDAALLDYKDKWTKVQADMAVEDGSNIYANAQLEYDLMKRTINERFKDNKAYRDQALEIAKKIHDVTMENIKKQHEMELENAREIARARLEAALDEAATGHAMRTRILREAVAGSTLRFDVTDKNSILDAMQNAQQMMALLVAEQERISSQYRNENVDSMLEEEQKQLEQALRDSTIALQTWLAGMDELDKALKRILTIEKAGLTDTPVAEFLQHFNVPLEGLDKFLDWQAKFLGKDGVSLSAENLGNLNTALIGAIGSLGTFGENMSFIMNMITNPYMAFGAFIGTFVKHGVNGLVKWTKSLFGAKDAQEDYTRKLKEMAATLADSTKKVIDFLLSRLKDLINSQISSLQDLYEVGAISGAEYEARAAQVNAQRPVDAGVAAFQGIDTIAGITSALVGLGESITTVGSIPQVDQAEGLEAIKAYIDAVHGARFRPVFERQIPGATHATTPLAYLNAYQAYVDAGISANGQLINPLAPSVRNVLLDLYRQFSGQGYGFAVGTPNVPYDMNATVHKGETIIPKTFADGIRSGEMVLSGGNSRSASLGGGDVYITVEGSVLTERELVEVVREGFARTNMRVSA